MLHRVISGKVGFFLLLCVYGGNAACAQTNFSIYSDELDNGFQNWSWNGGDNNFANASPVHSGSDSIAFTGGAWEAISVWHSDFNPAPYTNLNFWVNSGGTGGQIIQIYVQYGTNSATGYQLPALPATTNWYQYILPFSALNVVGVTNLNRISFQLTPYGTVYPFYLDDLNLTAVPPSPVHLRIDASQSLRQADARWFGLNTAVWDDSFFAHDLQRPRPIGDTHSSLSRRFVVGYISLVNQFKLGCPAPYLGKVDNIV
jgi:hypothetical protein